MEDPTKKIELSSEQQERLDKVNRAIANLQRIKVLIERGSDLGGRLGSVRNMVDQEINYVAIENLEISRLEKEVN